MRFAENSASNISLPTPAIVAQLSFYREKHTKLSILVTTLELQPELRLRTVVKGRHLLSER